MDGNEAPIERRKYKRYKVSKDVSVLLSNGDSLIGQLLDISMGGLSLSYVVGNMPVERRLHIYLFKHDQTFLKNIPFKVISDSLVQDTTLINSLILKRCSGQFGKLTNLERMQLDYLIAKHTAG